MICIYATINGSRMNGFFQKDVISIRDLGKEDLDSIFSATEKIIGLDPNQRREIARGKTLGYLFYEPSTRTRLSFQSAMALIGGTSLGIADVNSSSVQKGESLSDTVRVMSGYTDVLVLRHPLDGSSRFSAEIGLKIGIVGDLKYGRTVYSLLHGLCNYNVDVHLISPESLKIRKDSTYDIKKKLSYTESTNLDEYIDDLDVLYMTRIQKERFPDEEEYVKMRGSYVIGLDIVKKMKEDAIILHPLPRIDEISTDVDSSKQAKYFEQAENGKYTRAALLGLILNENGF